MFQRKKYNDYSQQIKRSVSQCESILELIDSQEVQRLFKDKNDFYKLYREPISFERARQEISEVTMLCDTETAVTLLKNAIIKPHDIIKMHHFILTIYPQNSVYTLATTKRTLENLLTFYNQNDVQNLIKSDCITLPDVFGIFKFPRRGHKNWLGDRKIEKYDLEKSRIAINEFIEICGTVEANSLLEMQVVRQKDIFKIFSYQLSCEITKMILKEILKIFRKNKSALDKLFNSELIEPADIYILWDRFRMSFFSESVQLIIEVFNSDEAKRLMEKSMTSIEIFNLILDKGLMIRSELKNLLKLDNQFRV